MTINRFNSLTRFEEIQSLLLTIELESNLLNKHNESSFKESEKNKLLHTRTCALNKVWKLLEIPLKDESENQEETLKLNEPSAIPRNKKLDGIKYNRSATLATVRLDINGKRTPLQFAATPGQMKGIGRKIAHLYSQKHQITDLPRENNTKRVLYPIDELEGWITTTIQHRFFDKDGKFIYNSDYLAKQAKNQKS